MSRTAYEALGKLANDKQEFEKGKTEKEDLEKTIMHLRRVH